MQQSLHLRSTNSAALFSTMSFDSSFGGSSINPSWDPDTMPAWNKTTECQDWSEDWHPCAFPYSGLSGYAPSATYCDTLFSEAFPDAYLGVHIFFLLAYSLLALLYGCRVLLCQVDLNRLPTSPPFAFLTQRLRDPAYRREPKPNKLKPGTTSVAMNVYDFCNCFMLVTAVLQVILSCDVEGWSDLIPYKVHVTLGVISQNIAVMTGIPITVNWMNLIHVWSNPFKNRNSLPPYGRVMRNTALATMWLVSFPFSFAALLRTRSCDNGCENGTLSCIGKVVFSLGLITIVLTSTYYAWRMYLVLKSDDDFNLRELLFPCCSSSSSTSSPDSDRARVLSSAQANDNSSSSRSASGASSSSSSSGSGSGRSDRSGSSGSSGGEDRESQKIIWQQIRKIWKIVAFSVVVSVVVISDNFSYCSGHFGTVKYESPPCSARDTVLTLKAMWFMLGGMLVFLLLVPARQQKQSEAAKKVLVERIKHNVTSSSSSSSGKEVALISKSSL